MDKIHFPIEAGHIMTFARAIGDANPVYYAAERADGAGAKVYAPPTFAIASAQFDPDCTLRPRLGDPWLGSGREPSGQPDIADSFRNRSNIRLYAEQHFEYFRHPAAGDHLTVTSFAGSTWTKASRRSGMLTFFETISEYRDQNEELVIRARMIIVETERMAPAKNTA